MTWRYTNRWFQFYTLNLVVLYLQSTIVRTRKLTLYIFTGWFLSCWFNKKNGLWRWNNCIWPGDDLSRKKKIKKNTMTDKYKQHAIATKMFTHSIHVRVVCQSAAIEHMNFVRDSIPAVAWKAWRFFVQENTIRSNCRHGLYNLSLSKFIW